MYRLKKRRGNLEKCEGWRECCFYNFYIFFYTDFCSMVEEIGKVSMCSGIQQYVITSEIFFKDAVLCANSLSFALDQLRRVVSLEGRDIQESRRGPEIGDSRNGDAAKSDLGTATLVISNN